jgi:membrane protease YdiL (CAAX protease family)
MAVPSKILHGGETRTIPAPETSGWYRAWEVPGAYHRYFTWFQLITTYVFMEFTLWSSRLSLQNRWFFITAVTLIVFVLIDRPSLQRMGLGLPSGLGATLVLAVSFLAAVVLVFAVRGVGGEIPANPTWPNLHLAWQYFVWALVQEFILQSFFFTRCEELFGSSAAVWTTATLFAAAHLPSPILTTFTLVGGLFFCEMFRRYRSIYPIGIVHAVLGLTIAMTMPDSLLHHMRVGIGYLRY